MDARVDSRIPIDVKKRAAQELEKHGMSLSEYVRMMLTSVANYGLPSDWGIPNAETIASLNEAIDDLSHSKSKGASSYSELEEQLNE